MLKVLWKDIFCESSITVFENKLTFMKKAELYTTTLMHCKVRQVLRALFNTNQRNSLQRAFLSRSY